MPLRVAVASSDGKFINQHFGHAEQFLIFDANVTTLRYCINRLIKVFGVEKKCED